MPVVVNDLAVVARSVSPSRSGGTVALATYGYQGCTTPRTEISLPTGRPVVFHPGLPAVAAATNIPNAEEVAEWMRMVESNVERTVGHSHNVARVAEDIARQEFNRARLEAGAANHHRQQAGAFENAAVLEVSALADALATFERSELRHANASSVQRRELENEANELFRRQVENFKTELGRISIRGRTHREPRRRATFGLSCVHAL